MKVDITALNLITIDCIYSELDRLPGLGEEISTPHFNLALGGGPVAALIAASRLGARVKLVTSLGTDRFSEIARDFLEQEHLPKFPENLNKFGNVTGVDVNQIFRR